MNSSLPLNKKQESSTLKLKKSPKVALVSLGCPKNLVDSEVILGYLAKSGFTITFDETEAEIIIVNTCSFIEDAKKESIEIILELAAKKTKGEIKLLVVAGCLAQNHGEKLLRQIPEIDLVVGTGMIDRIGQLCLEAINNQLKQLVFINEPCFIYTEQTPRIRATLPHVAYVKIAEGCNNKCSYCLIPSLRGRYRSRTEDSILAEVKELIGQGVKEINLIAQDTTAYSQDRPGSNDNLVSLLQRLSKLDGLAWIRLLYTYPDSISEKLLECIAQEPKVCKYIDMPAQHINDNILSRMNRKSTGKSIEHTLNLIRKIVPHVTLRTSLMVGFPGEEDKEFEELLSFVAEGWFDHLGVFSFSPQKGTPAAKMKGKIPESIKAKRCEIILNTQAEISLAKNQEKLKSVQEVIIDTVTSKTRSSQFLAIGRTQGHAPEIDGVVHVSSNTSLTVGEIRPVKIVKAERYDLFAEGIIN